jgi:hypothetical protein
MTESKPNVQFSDLNLPPELMASLESVGYETPSPIQVQAIPVLLKGNDLLGHAPTGTGKTAAFALPLIARTKVEESHVQPTLRVSMSCLSMAARTTDPSYNGCAEVYTLLWAPQAGFEITCSAVRSNSTNCRP